MPLTDIQRRVARVLRPFRTEDAYVGGGAALNQSWPRLSDDLDIFRDRRQGREGLPACIEPEIDALRVAGFAVEIVVEDKDTVEAIVRFYGFETKIQWMVDEETSKRFFPTLPDDELGYRLHRADLAVNKVLCARDEKVRPEMPSMSRPLPKGTLLLVPLFGQRAERTLP